MSAYDGDRRIRLWVRKFSCHKILYTLVGYHSLNVGNDENFVALVLISFGLFHSCKIDVSKAWYRSVSNSDSNRI